MITLRHAMNANSTLLVFEVDSVRAELRELRVWDDVEGIIEGTPRLHRRFRLMQLDQQLRAGGGLYIHDLDHIRADDAAAVDEWLPRHRMRARLTASWLPDHSTGNGRPLRASGRDRPSVGLGSSLAA